MTSLRLITMMALLAHATYARELRSSPATIRTPAQLSYEELVYIYQTRHGYQAAKPKTLTPCARAILGCCKDREMNANCSEMLKCGAHFFDDNPCDDKFILDALNAAKIFYEQFNSVP